MGGETAAVKDVLRASARARRAALSDNIRATASARLERFAALFAGLGRFRTAAGYLPLRGELDPTPLMQALAARGAEIALPRVTPGGLVFHRYRTGDPLVAASFGLSEPEAVAPMVEPDLLLVPLLAFDRRGNRLGYGKGYYDRALARLPGATTVGLGFAVQEVEAVPVSAHDQPLDYVLTEAGLIDCRRQRGQ